MRKIFISCIVLCLSTILYANEKVNLYFHKDTISNAHTALLFLEAKDIENPKLTFEKLNMNFLPDAKENRYFALIPVSYYTKAKQYNVIVSYVKNGEKIFKGVPLTIVDGNYKSETLTVQPSKINPNKKNKERTQREYKEAMEIYNVTSNGLHTSFVHPMNSKITSAFGNKRVYNGLLQSYHSGTDYRAAIGTPIYSSAKGVVKLASDRYYAGKTVLVDHGYGVYSCYFHLDKISVKVGDVVEQKELLGYSGNTGRVTGPHLHFSIRINTVLVDPIQFIETINVLNK